MSREALLASLEVSWPKSKRRSSRAGMTPTILSGQLRETVGLSTSIITGMAHVSIWTGHWGMPPRSLSGIERLCHRKCSFYFATIHIALAFQLTMK